MLRFQFSFEPERLAWPGGSPSLFACSSEQALGAGLVGLGPGAQTREGGARREHAAIGVAPADDLHADRQPSIMPVGLVFPTADRNSPASREGYATES